MKTNTTPILFGAAALAGGFRGPGVERFPVLHARVGLLFGVLLVLFAFRPSVAQASDRWETLQAIHLIENPTNSTRVGRRGELGPYQFRPSTWKMHTKKPFHLAADREEADRVAVQHYEWICRQLERHGIEPTPYRIALAWNAGVTASIRGSAPAASHSYASRVEAMAADLRRRQLARE
ncbi:hypothetical protein DB347_14385 [Opitutaceae bacterium EW11]|nr:hypothetical protein DB347_14385 [Opitutaceae bacterium EW11]